MNSNFDNTGHKITSYWTYFLRSLILLLVDAILLGVLYGILASSDTKVLHGTLIGVGVFAGVSYISYWIYMIVHETRIRKGLSYGTSHEDRLKRKRLDILKSHKFTAKAKGERISKQEAEDIMNGKYDNEV